MSAVYEQDFTPLADRYLLHGDPEMVLEKVRRYADAGAETLVIALAGDGKQRMEAVDLFAETVLPQLQADPLTVNY